MAALHSSQHIETPQPGLVESIHPVCEIPLVPNSVLKQQLAPWGVIRLFLDTLASLPPFLSPLLPRSPQLASLIIRAQVLQAGSSGLSLLFSLLLAHPQITHKHLIQLLKT